jgi:protein TonB
VDPAPAHRSPERSGAGPGPESGRATTGPPAAAGPAPLAGRGEASGRDEAAPSADLRAALPPGPPGGAGPPGEPDGAPEGAIPPEYEPYVRALRQRIQDRLVYPWLAVRRGQEGVVELLVHVDRQGSLLEVDVVPGRAAESLRTAAVAAVRASAPFPFPAGLAARPLVVRLPVEFRLR